MPVSGHVDEQIILKRIDPMKDVDGFHPENVGKLVTGESRFKPCTPHGIERPLAATGVETTGKDVVVAGGSDIVGKRGRIFSSGKHPGERNSDDLSLPATDLAEKTKNADIVIAASVPELIDGSMLSKDTLVIDVNGEGSWLYAAIDIETKLILDVALFSRHGTDPAAAFLQKLREKHDLSEAEFLVDQFSYRTILSRWTKRSGQLYRPNLIEKWSRALKMRIDRFHNPWVGSRASVREWIEQFAHHYNYQRPHQALDGNVSAEKVQK